jgi:hypothetical protein
MSKGNEVEELKAQLQLLRLDFAQRLTKIERKINDLHDPESLVSPEKQSLAFKSLAQDSSLQHTQERQGQSSSSDSPVNDNPASTFHQTELHASKQSHKALFSLKDALVFLQPVLSVFSPIFKIYQHYKDKGQAPIFLFTLIGIALLVGGFAYLAQLLIGGMGAGSKTLLLFVVSTGVIAGSVKLTKLERYSEFASAGISLGLLLNFVTIYVAGSVYHLLPNWLVLLAYFVTAIGGYVFSNLYNTRVVSALSLIGGAWIPLVVELQSEALIYYLIGLVMLVSGALVQGLKREWNWLIYLAAVMSFSCLQWVLNGVVGFTILSLFVEIFYLLFLAYIHYVLADKTGLSRERLTLLALVMFATIGLCYESLPLNSFYLTAIACFNAAMSLVLLLRTRQKASHHGLIHTAILSVWLLVAIVTSIAADFWSLAFALEGLFLLYFSIKERFTTIRIEALTLLAFSLIYSIVAMWPYFPSPALLSIKGWVLVLSIGVTLIVSRHVLKKERNMLKWEGLIFKHMVAIESVWLATVFIATAWLYLGFWGASTLVVLQLILLVRARFHSCSRNEILALLCLLPISYCWVIGAEQVNSFSFRMLPEFSKLALTVLYLELWLFAEFYRRFYKAGRLAVHAETMRILFYFILPLSFLPSVFKWHSEYLALATWASALISYALGRLVKDKVLRLETIFISVAACFVSIIIFILNVRSYFELSLMGLIFGALYYCYFIYSQRKGLHPSVEKKLASMGLFYLGACISVCLVYYTSLSVGFLSYSIYLFALLFVSDTTPLLKRNGRVIVNCLLIGIPTSWLLLSFDNSTASALYVMSNIGLMLLCLFKVLGAGKVISRMIGLKETTIIVFHVAIALSYLQLFASWDLMLLTSPGLIIHGSVLLFSDSNNKNLAKMAMLYIFIGLIKLAFIDAENAILWQKVVLLIGIGCFMLFAAFVYQKRHNQLENSTAEGSQ